MPLNSCNMKIKEAGFFLAISKNSYTWLKYCDRKNISNTRTNYGLQSLVRDINILRRFVTYIYKMNYF